MKFLESIWQFLTEKKVKTVSEPLTDTTAVTEVAPVDATAPEDSEKASFSEVDIVLSKLKALLIAADHDVESTFDKFADLAKALAAQS